MTTALFIGRFQPFHKGHVQAVRDILKKHSHIIIAIGSSQESNTIENPFRYEERKAMIDAVMKKEGIADYSIPPVPDIHRHEQWVEHVCKCVGTFDVVYTGSELTKRLFSEKGFRVEDLPRHGEISATEVRQRIEHNKDWERLVPREVVQYIKKKKE